MELGLAIKAILALVFVLGLLFLVIWLLKYCEIKGSKNRFFSRLSTEQRVQIVEIRRIDPRNSVVLLRRDNIEHLILLGNTQNLILETNIQTTPAKDQA